MFLSFLSDRNVFTDVLKVLRLLGESRESQISSRIGKEKVNKVRMGLHVNHLSSEPSRFRLKKIMSGKAEVIQLRGF